MIFGTSAAWASEQLCHGGRWQRSIARLADLAWAVSVAIPIVIHAAVWEQTIGKFGWAAISAGRGVDPARWFQQSAAVTWIHVMASTGLVYMMVRIAMARLPPGILAIARLETSPAKAFWTILLPACRGWVFVGGVLVALIAGTEMTAADLYAMVTVADRFYLYFAADPTLVSATIAAMPTAFGIAAAILLVIRIKDRPLQTPSIDRVEKFRFAVPKPPARFLCRANVIAGLALVVATASLMTVLGFPIAATIAKLGQTSDGWNFFEAIDRLSQAPRLYKREWMWSMMVGGGSAILATTIAGCLIAATPSNRAAWRRTLIEILLWTMFCLPGPLVGLAVVSVFRLPFPAADALATQTLIPLWIATLFRTLPIAYLVLRFSLSQLPIGVRHTAAVHYGPWRRFIDVIAPSMLGPYLVTLLLTSIIAAGDVPVTLPVAPPGVTTMATRLFGLLHSGARYPEAVLTILYVTTIAAGVAIVGGIVTIRRWWSIR